MSGDSFVGPGYVNATPITIIVQRVQLYCTTKRARARSASEICDQFRPTSKLFLNCGNIGAAGEMDIFPVQREHDEYS